MMCFHMHYQAQSPGTATLKMQMGKEREKSVEMANVFRSTPPNCLNGYEGERIGEADDMTEMCMQQQPLIAVEEKQTTTKGYRGKLEKQAFGNGEQKEAHSLGMGPGDRLNNEMYKMKNCFLLVETVQKGKRLRSTSSLI